MGINILCLFVGLALGYLFRLIWTTNRGPYYYYKGRQYLFLCEGKMKTPTGNWTASVSYRSTKDDQIYSREKGQFYRLFKTIEQIDGQEE